MESLIGKKAKIKNRVKSLKFLKRIFYSAHIDVYFDILFFSLFCIAIEFENNMKFILLQFAIRHIQMFFRTEFCRMEMQILHVFESSEDKNVCRLSEGGKTDIKHNCEKDVLTSHSWNESMIQIFPHFVQQVEANEC